MHCGSIYKDGHLGKSIKEDAITITYKTSEME